MLHFISRLTRHLLGSQRIGIFHSHFAKKICKTVEGNNYTGRVHKISLVVPSLFVLVFLSGKSYLNSRLYSPFWIRQPMLVFSMGTENMSVVTVSNGVELWIFCAQNLKRGFKLILARDLKPRLLSFSLTQIQLNFY